MVWSMADRSVAAVDVTARYIPAQAAIAATAEATSLYLRLWDTSGGERLVAKVSTVGAEGESTEHGSTRAGTADLNDMLAVPASTTDPVLLRLSRDGATRTALIQPASEGPRTVDLAWDQLGLSRAEAEALVQEAWQSRCEVLRDERAAELEAMAIEAGDHELRLMEREFGEAPEGGRSLWISMHGGGGAPPELNDQQWQNQIRLYEPLEGIYIAPRAPSNTRNLWYRAEVDVLFDQLIETYVAARGVDPDRVYLMGYSAGGDGVYQLAPRMADRFAAAAMMAGHPNETQPLGLRNLPFAIYMGGEDFHYDRNKVAASWGEKLAELRAADPEGYPHQVTIYEGLGHWMERRDASALPWMASHDRDPWPSKVVWHQDDVIHDRFYWLAVPAGSARARSTITAEVDGQVIRLESSDVEEVILRLRDGLVDLDLPVVVMAGDETLHDGLVPRTAPAIQGSIAERADPRSAATALLTVKLGQASDR